MKPVWQILQAPQLGGTLEEVKKNLGGFTVKMAEDLQRILSKGASVQDNLAMTYIEFDAIHATETRVANPFKSVPQAFIPISAFSLTGGTNGVGARNTGVQRQILGQPILNTSRTDGFLGLTVNYDLAHTQPLLTMQRDTNYTTLAHGVAAIVPWESVTNSRGSGISHSAGLFTITEAGTYEVAANLGLEGGNFASGEVWIESPAGTRLGNVSFDILPGGQLSHISWPIKVAAGGTVGVWAYQTNGAAANRTIQGSNVNKARVAIQRLYNDTLPTATVRGILVEA